MVNTPLFPYLPRISLRKPTVSNGSWVKPSPLLLEILLTLPCGETSVEAFEFQNSMSANSKRAESKAGSTRCHEAGDRSYENWSIQDKAPPGAECPTEVHGRRAPPPPPKDEQPFPPCASSAARGGDADDSIAPALPKRTVRKDTSKPPTQ
ncbi:hypothetical protein CAPTEDRAFT_228284 [Capitella teleta]|uniref:Uncharacterized protein n=1 Tax=Capitella teleta TaxID=283909 RepID=R7UR63_CAPTE|nr:hypothetical protein CAPTEDRAFT_228284 [Capitella teleta]|eukprot:ELU08665.1 hypothetical protein CAPTEDRAFT_228284 [Capitella teleta]